MYLIQFSDVKGDQNIGKYKDCFKVTGVEYESGRSTHQAPVGSSSRIWGSTSYSPIHINKFACKASRALQDYCNFGKPAECKIAFLDSTNTEYLEIKLTSALFSNYKFSAKGGVPHDSFDITYTAISSHHTPKDIRGLPGTSSSTSFNLTNNTR